jgi:hypothetical protein
MRAGLNGDLGLCCFFPVALSLLILCEGRIFFVSTSHGCDLSALTIAQQARGAEFPQLRHFPFVATHTCDVQIG